MFSTMKDAVTFWKDPANQDSFLELSRRFRDHILREEPRIQRLYETSERPHTLPLAWGIHLAVQEMPHTFQCVEMGFGDAATKQTHVGVVQYFAKLWGKTCTFYSSHMDVDIQKYQEALGISLDAPTMLNDAESFPSVQLLLVHSDTLALPSHLSDLSENGIVMLPTSVWNSIQTDISVNFQILFEVSGYSFLVKNKIQ